VLRLDPNAPEPFGEQLRRGLRRAIAEGDVARGEALPPVRQLAADLGVNLNTVARAYRDLEREGLVRTARGRGTRVVADRDAEPLPATDVRARVRDLLADATLAGYTAREIRRIFHAELERRMA